MPMPDPQYVDGPHAEESIAHAFAAVAPTLVFALAAVLLCCALIVIGLATRPSGGLPLPKGSHVVHVDERDFHIQLSNVKLPAGDYVFVDTNHGPSPHELVMWKTTAPADRLPLRTNHRVNEDSPTLTSALDSGSALNPGETRLLTTTLEPGHYVIACNLPGHFIAGMRVDINVD
jgi:uncharacterized cupredoxin-like copper-binding protein